MYRYVLKRLVMLIPVILITSFIVFFIINLAPGDVVAQLTGGDATQEEIAQVRAQLGLDQPILIRYIKYLGGLLHGDLGTSYVTGRSVYASYMEKLPATLQLALASIFVSILISIPLGISSAVHQGSIRDNVGMVAALLGLSMPNFWLGLLLIIVFALNLGWLPSGGSDGFKSIILPAITVGTGLTAMLTRTTRSSMLDVIRQDYLRTARAKGVPERLVIRKHALKNALIPVITVIGTQLGSCLGGAILTETVFSWPGVGRLILDAVNSRDIPMVTGCIVLKTITISIILLIVDLLYAVVDPRIRAQYSKGGK
ncbi:MAG: ABC transporter permease [Clostridia bacterium]|nr:ABC transporter permease [Clostridia bacterium]